ncbi:NADPH oxidase 5-like [Pollicipes pollicipes]|uniref:NADPH oxidase 5-like n=1 Tax=Pollicipes pollicipes TaxID=41117 RepID=UPI0018855880|nr:NADPH oxidase 5-like [Pollicipes pollicipes]
MAIIVATSLLRHHMTFLAFFLTHQLYVVLYGLMIIHAGNFWVYLLLPVCLWSAELLLRFIYSPRPSNIVEVTLLPSNVIVLVLEKPPQMIFKPGDYVYLQIPTIGKFEWVKFTITSAPEQPDLLTVHVQIKNNWSFRLRNFFLRDVSFHYIPHRLHALESITVIQKLVKSWRNMFGGFQNIEVPMGKPRETRKERLQRNQVDAMKVEEKHLTMDVVLSEDDLAPEPEPEPPPPPHGDPFESHEVSQFGGFAVRYSAYTQNFGKTLHFRGTVAPGQSAADRARFQSVKHHSLIPSLEVRDDASASIGEPSREPGERSSIAASMRQQRDDDERRDAGDENGCLLDKTVKVFIDGPYGTTGSERTGIFSARHAIIVLVGPEVGPFAAILQSILIRKQPH